MVMAEKNKGCFRAPRESYYPFWTGLRFTMNLPRVVGSVKELMTQMNCGPIILDYLARFGVPAVNKQGQYG
jgi:hypothetical protein